MAGRLYDTEGESARPPLCATAPLLWSLLPLALVLVLSRQYGQAVTIPVAVSAACGLALLACFKRSPIPRSVAGVMAFSLTLAMAVDRLHAPRQSPDWEQRPAREVQLTMRIEQSFNARRPEHAAGVARIMAAELPLDTMSGAPVAFHLQSLLNQGRQPQIGEVLAVRGVLNHLAFPQEMDPYHEYLRGRGIWLSLNRGIILQTLEPPPLAGQIRARLQARFEAMLQFKSSDPGAAGHVLASMLMGNRSLLNDERVELYRNSGSFHLFAVSGLHVGSIALGLHLLGVLARIPRRWNLLLMISAVWGYVWVTGASPSAVRAGIMISTVMVMRPLSRQPHLFPALVLSAWMVLIWDPQQLFSPGFQLSYAVVGAIVLIGLPFCHLLQARFQQLSREYPPSCDLIHTLRRMALRILQTVVVSFSAALASMPLIIQFFSLHTPVGFVGGVLLNPLAMATVMVGGLTLLVGLLPVPISISGWVGVCAYPPIHVMEAILSGLIRVPGAYQTRDWAFPNGGIFAILSALALAWILQVARQQGQCQHLLWHAVPPVWILAILQAFTVIK